MPDTLIYIATGAFAGFSAGLLGIGGGLIIVPVLYFVFETQGYEPRYLMHMALATSLATIIVTSISSTLAHHRKKAVLWRIVLMLSPGICLGAWLGADFASRLNTDILRPVFAIFELFVAALMISRYQSRQHRLTIKPASALIGGSLIGSISSIVGIGGGTLTVPFLHWHQVNIKNAVATSAACGLPIAVFATASYIINGWDISVAPEGTGNTFGYVQLEAFILIAVSSFLLAPVGARIAHSVSDIVLKNIFAVLLFSLAIKMLLA